MKLKTTVMLATCGVLASAAGAFAVPVPRTTWTSPSVALAKDGPAESRITAGDTLLVDARLGHASIAKDGKGETYLFAQVGASEADAKTTTPVNLTVVIDRSGSMKGERIANAMNAAVFALERLREDDTISVVSFDTAAQVVVAPTRIAARNRPSIESAIRGIRLGGDTCISCGLEEGMRQLTSDGPLTGDRVSRMILLSDGATNAGIRDLSGLRAMAGRMRGRGATISTIGVDVDFDEKVMAAIAIEGNGRHHFVASASGLSAVFSEEFDDVLASVAKEAELSIELAPGVEVAEVFDRSFRREGNKLIVPFGTFSAKQEKTVLVRLRVPTDRDGTADVASLKLGYRDLLKHADRSASGNLAIDVRSDGAEQREVDPFVAARLERSRTAQTLTEANSLFEAGRLGEARSKLASRRVDLKRSEGETLALARRSPPAAAPQRANKSLGRDFDDQLGAVAQAETRFAPAPAPVAGAPFASAVPAASATRLGKEGVKANQAAASDLGF